ncbi:unnamed protein product [Lampetra planeri]
MGGGGGHKTSGLPCSGAHSGVIRSGSQAAQSKGKVKFCTDCLGHLDVKMSSKTLDKATRSKLIEEGLWFLQSPQPFDGSDSEYEGFLRKLVSCLWADGDELYRAGDAATAQRQYGEALDVVEYMEKEGLHCPNFVNERLHVNRAACHLRHNDFSKALEDCALALKLNEKNAQACYHRARALRAMGSVREAYDSVVICSKLMPQDQQVIALMQELAQALGLRLRKAYISQCNGKTITKPIGGGGGGGSGVTGGSGGGGSKAATAPAKTKGHKGGSGGKGALGGSAPPPLPPHQAGPGLAVVTPAQTRPASKVGPTRNFATAATTSAAAASAAASAAATASGVRVREAPKPVLVFPAAGKSGAPTKPELAPLRPGDAAEKPPNAAVPVKETPPGLVNGYGGGGGQQQMPPGFAERAATSSSCRGLDSLDDVSTALPAGLAGPGWAGVRMGNNPLAETHDLRQACDQCFFSLAAVSEIHDYKYFPDLEHKCKKDLLIGRLRNSEDPCFKKIRPRPQMINYIGSYYICQDITEGKACRFPGHCRFAYSQEEIDVWTLERKGLMQRELLFAPVCGTGGLRVRLTLQGILEEHHGIFLFLCEECFDNKPRMLSKESKENPKYCTNQSVKHIFDETKCLVHVLRGTSVRYSKIRPLNELSQFDICRHEIRYGCLREDKCNFAHSFVELKVWVMQQQSGISHEEIEMDCSKIVAQSSGALAAPTHKVRVAMPFRMKCVCSQCWRNGQVTEPEATLKYCNSKARHTWSKERRVLLVMSPERKKWTQIRPFPNPKNVPLQFDLCAHVAKGKKCTFLGNCTFAHSQEEKEVWTYMRESNIKETEKLYEIWMETHGPKAAAKDTTGGTLSGISGQCSEHISLPTDYADITTGFHCWLCGKNCNGGKQWQQHITSERHRDRVFLDDDGQNWQHRFPAGEFSLCPLIEHGNICPEESECKYAHGAAELQEWIERRDYLKSKLAKAINDKLIDERGDFGKYSFLTK